MLVWGVIINYRKCPTTARIFDICPLLIVEVENKLTFERFRGGGIRTKKEKLTRGKNKECSLDFGLRVSYFFLRRNAYEL